MGGHKALTDENLQIAKEIGGFAVLIEELRDFMTWREAEKHEGHEPPVTIGAAGLGVILKGPVADRVLILLHEHFEDELEARL